MARTPSRMLALGTELPEFALLDVVSGNWVAASSLAGKPAVVFFICNHCPFVRHIRTGIADFGRYCLAEDVAMVAISSNDARAYPADAPPLMRVEAAQAGYVFPYLYDESQIVARSFDAACTPDLYIFDQRGKLAYRGQFDGARPGNDIPVTGSDARAAIAALKAGRPPSSQQIPSIGCNIKWKPD
jgi:AhpC/TSA family